MLWSFDPFTQAGKINKGPQGQDITVMMGTNTDEMALFIIAIGVIIEGVALPVGDKALPVVANFLAAYHDNWNETTAAQILAAYPTADFATDAYGLSVAGTDFIFRCGTRNSVRALAAAGVKTYLYQFNHRFAGWVDPSSKLCELDSMLKCGIAHASELPFVFDQKEGAGDSTADRHVAKEMGLYWTNMAKYGSPNGPPNHPTDEPEVIWPAYSMQFDEHLSIADPIVVGHGLGQKN
jgi:carboxylesterase type B